MNETKDTKRRVELFFENKINVHIDTFDNRFYNGIILELGSDFLLIFERVLGKTFILFSEIRNIEPYKERGE
jgi:hypothetical protein